MTLKDRQLTTHERFDAAKNNGSLHHGINKKVTDIQERTSLSYHDKERRMADDYNTKTGFS